MRETPSTHDTLTTINHHITTNEPPLEKKSAKVDSPDFLFDVTEQTQSDFKKLRMAKKAPITERAITAIRNEAEKAGIDLETALIECCARGWTGFKAEWYIKAQAPPAYQTRQQQAAIAARSIFKSESQEKVIKGDVIEHERLTSKVD